ncbi:MAG: ImuA family protein [Hyphomicrobiales bacterium]
MNEPLDIHFPLRKGRAHEVMGASAPCFAAIMCGLGKKPTLWITESWQREHISPSGLAPFCDPQKIILARGQSHLEVLAASEEALRSGAISTLVVELNKPLTLTIGRRLQLAAETGKTTGIFMISESAGSNAAETRWQCAPVFDAEDSTLQEWKLIKNKSGTLGVWRIRWDEQTRYITVVSETGKRAHFARAAG